MTEPKLLTEAEAMRLYSMSLAVSDEPDFEQLDIAEHNLRTTLAAFRAQMGEAQ